MDEIIKKNNFRKNIIELEKIILKNPNSFTKDLVDKTFPIKSTFAGACYIREMFMPAGHIMTTKIHKKDHPFFLLKGKMTIASENFNGDIKAPYQGITIAGTKRVIYSHSDCILITVHSTDKLTVEEVEEDVIAKDFNDPLVSLLQITTK